MAIKIPNLGTGNGQTGDNEFKIRSDYNHNFSDRNNAASRLVGNSNGQLIEMTTDGIAGVGLEGRSPSIINHQDNTFPTGVYRTAGASGDVHPTKQWKGWSTVFRLWQFTESFTDLSFNAGSNSPRFMMQNVQVGSGGAATRTDWVEFYTTGNTTKEAGTGYLVASSPVLKVQHDNFEKVHEAEQLNIDVQHLATGVYAITGTTGLRENDGWYLKPPKDINGNVLCICEATQEGDVITLKTYKKRFDFETVSIVADYEQPTDIPDGAEVMLRFNDLSAEPMPPEV